MRSKEEILEKRMNIMKDAENARHHAANCQVDGYKWNFFTKYADNCDSYVRLLDWVLNES